MIEIAQSSVRKAPMLKYLKKKKKSSGFLVHVQFLLPILLVEFHSQHSQLAWVSHHCVIDLCLAMTVAKL